MILRVSGRLHPGATARGESAAPAADTARAVAPSPRPVTRGERSEQAAKVDWLHATFDSAQIDPSLLIARLRQVMGRPVRGLHASAGRFGFAERIDLQAGVGSTWVNAGCLAFGGEHQRGRVMLQLTGGGCGLVKDWHAMRDLLEGIGATITRLDLAVDYLNGEATVDDAVSLYECDAFNSGGRRPTTKVAGDWIGSGDDGRTFYVGKAANGKTLRVYEKGKQLGDSTSEWVRFEVQFGNRDRVIPMRALVDRDAFFAGAYPALESLLEVAACRIEVDREKSAVSMLHLLDYLRTSYGRVVDTACTWFGLNPSELVEAVRVRGLPRRVDPSATEGGAYTSRVLDVVKGK